MIRKQFVFWFFVVLALSDHAFAQTTNHVVGPDVTVQTDGTKTTGQVNIATENAGPIQFFTNKTRRGYIDGSTGVLTGFTLGSTTLTAPTINTPTVNGGTLTDSTIASAAAVGIDNGAYYTAQNSTSGSNSLLRSDTSDNTEINVPTGKLLNLSYAATPVAKLDTANTNFGPVAAAGLSLGTSALPWSRANFGSATIQGEAGQAGGVGYIGNLSNHGFYTMVNSTFRWGSDTSGDWTQYGIGGVNIRFQQTGTGVRVDSGTLAATGSTQADAAAISHIFTEVTGADGTKGVHLPAGVLYMHYWIINSNTTNALKLYSNAAGDLIYGQAGTTAVSMAAKTAMDCVKYDSTHWYCNSMGAPF